ncbi:unnamed protein product [Pleuronectes platessa]|uniref:Uncharacterized protein n=1 Tax=Pleuronectes platessa TaxID=8262 RepID=A0A9N7TW56_PLEPL|nr:unnamed protein product [Pleuronectes platessa]
MGEGGAGSGESMQRAAARGSDERRREIGTAPSTTHSSSSILTYHPFACPLHAVPPWRRLTMALTGKREQGEAEKKRKEGGGMEGYRIRERWWREQKCQMDARKRNGGREKEMDEDDERYTGVEREEGQIKGRDDQTDRGSLNERQTGRNRESREKEPLGERIIRPLPPPPVQPRMGGAEYPLFQ